MNASAGRNLEDEIGKKDQPQKEKHVFQGAADGLIRIGYFDERHARAVVSSPVIESSVPSARTPRAMKGTDQSAVKPELDMLRLTGKMPPSNPGFRQSP